MFVLWLRKGLLATFEGNINKWFCLIVFIVVVSFVFVHIWAKRNISKSGGHDCKSWGGFCCFLIFQIFPMVAIVVISGVKVMTGSGEMRKSKKKTKQPNPINKMNEKPTVRIRKKRDGADSVVLLEPLAQRFVWFGESDVRPRHFQTHRVLSQCYKTPNGSKKQKENKREGGNSIPLSEALARRLIVFGESDVHPCHFQTRRIGGPGRG